MDTGMRFSIIGNEVGLGNALLKNNFSQEKLMTYHPDDSVNMDEN